MTLVVTLDNPDSPRSNHFTDSDSVYHDHETMSSLTSNRVQENLFKLRQQLKVYENL